MEETRRNVRGNFVVCLRLCRGGWRHISVHRWRATHVLQWLCRVRISYVRLCRLYIAFTYTISSHMWQWRHVRGEASDPQLHRTSSSSSSSIIRSCRIMCHSLLDDMMTIASPKNCSSVLTLCAVPSPIDSSRYIDTSTVLNEEFVRLAMTVCNVECTKEATSCGDIVMMLLSNPTRSCGDFRLRIVYNGTFLRSVKNFSSSSCFSKSKSSS